MKRPHRSTARGNGLSSVGNRAPPTMVHSLSTTPDVPIACALPPRTRSRSPSLGVMKHCRANSSGTSPCIRSSRVYVGAVSSVVRLRIGAPSRTLRAAGTSSRIFGAASPTTGPSGSRRASTSASRATVSRTCCAKSSPTRGGAPTVESKILQVLLECKIDDDRRRHLSGSARGVTGTMMMGAASSGIALARKQMVSPTLPRSRWRKRRDRQLSTCRNRAHSCSRTCLVFSQGKSRRRTRNRDHRPGQARAGVASLSPLIPAPLRIPLAEFQER